MVNGEHGLRVILFDRTCKNRAGLGLSRAWSNGSRLYGALGRTDATFGAANFEEGLAWLNALAPARPIDEVQFWGHGKWGGIFIGPEKLGREALVAGSAHHAALSALRGRLSKGALFWFRTCETFGATQGHDFARAWTDFFGCRAAGHTYVIGYWQSGLHALHPGDTPHWSPDEGLSEGSPSAPLRAAPSTPRLPHTISCFTGKVPAGW